MSTTEDHDDSYFDKIESPSNRAMRRSSGRIDDDRPLVAFLYRLARDEVTLGRLETILDQVADEREVWQFTNGWLALWARDAADRLEAPTWRVDVAKTLRALSLLLDPTEHPAAPTQREWIEAAELAIRALGGYVLNPLDPTPAPKDPAQ